MLKFHQPDLTENIHNPVVRAQPASASREAGASQAPSNGSTEKE